MIRRAVKRSVSINNADLRKNGRRENVQRRNPVRNGTEKDRAYEREYQRKRRENDPAYKEKQKQRQKAWRTKNPDYDKNRYATDPEYAESRKAARSGTVCE